MVALIISILVSLGTVLPGTTTPSKGTPSSTPPTVLGGTSTWTNGGVD